MVAVLLSPTTTTDTSTTTSTTAVITTTKCRYELTSLTIIDQLTSQMCSRTVTIWYNSSSFQASVPLHIGTI